MKIRQDHLHVRLARSEQDLRASERLRYKIFVEELGGDGPMVDHAGRFERDRYDPHFDHLILVDATRDPAEMNHVVGVYRVMPGDRAEAIGGFYSEQEYDVEVLKASGRRLLELGRSCVDVDYRGGVALHRLWTGLGNYVERTGAEILFGVASFHGTDCDALSMPMSHLHDAHLAPPELRVRALPELFQPMDLLAPDKIDRVAAMRDVPPLIKAYLRMGGFVGEGAFIDHIFNTTDVCLVLDTARLTDRDRARFTGGGF